MTKVSRQLKNLFTGKWHIICLYGNVVEQGWTLFKRYSDTELIWEFSEQKTIIFRPYEIAYEGTLKEIFGDTLFETKFAYHTSNRELYIDRSDYLDDGFCNICINDRYRVEQISSTELWLYDLEDVEKEPSDYRFKMKLRKIA